MADAQQARRYQSHGLDEPGMSASDRKLQRLHFPKDLTGKTALDIGCNEGFFSNIAASRGAKSVIGIDFSKPALEFAQGTYTNPNISFRFQRWDLLPDGLFDLVLWTSAMHYEKDPLKVTKQIADRLTLNGLFILECGVYPSAEREMVPVQRHSDTTWYPSRSLLLDHLLADFAVRQVEQGEITEGDPIPRSVFHCTKRLPTVLVVRGATQAGKTTSVNLLQSSATKVLRLDVLLTRIAVAKYHHSDLQRLIRDKYDPADLGKIYTGIDAAGLAREFAELISDHVTPTDKLVVMEGFLSEVQTAALSELLSKRAVFWDAERLRGPAEIGANAVLSEVRLAVSSGAV